MKQKPYDSTKDTKRHIAHVAALLVEVSDKLMQRAKQHDASKLVDPEKATFDKVTPLLADTVYGTAKYKAALEQNKPAIRHHYANNRHHPEHFTGGINDMNLIDLIEMVCDWWAASHRHGKPRGFLHSLDVNRSRFAIGGQLAKILKNTGVEMGWVKPKGEQDGSE